VPIIEHADVRRMLLKQKAIVEGGLSLLATTARFADLAAHATTPEARRRASLLLDLLTPVAKSFPAERGFEANALAVQIHGGYGYSSEFLPEAWLRDQKLNTIHEGTTGIQGMDLLGRKVVAAGGEPLRLLREEIATACTAAAAVGLDGAPLLSALGTVEELTLHLAGLGLRGDVDAMMLHSTDYLELFSILVVAWQWLRQATVAKRADRDDDFYRGKVAACAYWFANEVVKIPQLAEVCRADRSYADVKPSWL
jgi:hypothetical protein